MCGVAASELLCRSSACRRWFHSPHSPTTTQPPPLLQDLETFFEPIFAMFKEQRRSSSETLGDFTARVGFEALRQYQAAYTPTAAAPAKVRLCVGGGSGGWGRVCGGGMLTCWLVCVTSQAGLCRWHSTFIRGLAFTAYPRYCPPSSSPPPQLVPIGIAEDVHAALLAAAAKAGQPAEAIATEAVRKHLGM